MRHVNVGHPSLGVLNAMLLLQVPTTLMGMVDAAIGIKTAVNFDQHKNRLGTYCAPMAVFLDPTFLASLHPRHIANGAAEIIKMACMRDGDLFAALESYAQTDGYDFQVRHCSQLVAASNFVQQDMACAVTLNLA